MLEGSAITPRYKAMRLSIERLDDRRTYNSLQAVNGLCGDRRTDWRAIEV